MLTFQIDQTLLEEKVARELSKRLEQIEHRVTFWDTKELCKQTNMSLNFIKETFFMIQGSLNIEWVQNGFFPLKNVNSF